MSKWELIFEDQFDELDKTKWNLVEAGNGFGNKELQFYTPRPKNAFIRDHQLVIKAHKERYHRRKFTSAKLTTKGSFSFQYGMVEIRAKLPYGQGMWPALWMMPEKSRYGYWPSCGEIDIMESLGHEPEKIYGTIHFGVPHAEIGPRFYIPNYDKDSFHTYKLIWEKDKIYWYVDDFCYGKVDQWFSKREEKYPFPAPFDQPFYLIINLAVGGNFPRNPNRTTIFPQEFIIDYVRVYQRKEE